MIRWALGRAIGTVKQQSKHNGKQIDVGPPERRMLSQVTNIAGALVVATADGGVGTGNGLAGGVVAVIVGLISMTLGGMALARSRRTA